MQSFDDMIPAPLKAVATIDLQAPSITPNVSLSTDCLENIVLALAYPYKPIVKVIKWWGTFIAKMTTYVTQRTTSLGSMLDKINKITPPNMPT